MKRVFLLVEGETEVAFVKRVLQPHLPGLHFQPIKVTTRPGGPSPRKGGSVSYQSFKSQVFRLLDNPVATMVTTLLDYQGLNLDFPGRRDRTEPTAAGRAAAVQDAMGRDIQDRRYEPFVLMHEFEALLLVKPEVIAEVLQQPRLREPLQAIRKERPEYARTPEEINERAETSPSSRIHDIALRVTRGAAFQKVVHGPLVADRIGLAAIRSECPHFDSWLTRLEAHASP